MIEERLYSTGNDELDYTLEKAFCDGYEYAQREYATLKELQELRNREEGMKNMPIKVIGTPPSHGEEVSSEDYPPLKDPIPNKYRNLMFDLNKDRKPNPKKEEDYFKFDHIPDNSLLGKKASGFHSVDDVTIDRLRRRKHIPVNTRELIKKNSSWENKMNNNW